MNGIVFKGDNILRRHCPTSPMHWRVDEPNGRCPVCRAKIVERTYVPLDAVVEVLRAEGDPDLAGGYHDAAALLEWGFEGGDRTP